jgi:glycosyltransferase involved in cell wall biosynthesis
MIPDISVIICSHNPKMGYLTRVLRALERQILSQNQWELILIDNCSDRPLAEIVDLTWHTNSRHVREAELGLTQARLRGIKEAKAEVLVFVDDDNILYPDYLELVVEIAKKWAILGVWGGQALPEFESTPPDWTKPYWGSLAIKIFDKDMWSNMLEVLPVGAGMCVRKSVATKYVEIVERDPKRLNLDRKGKDERTGLIISGGDLDLAMTSSELNLGTGLFARLQLTHLIPDSRLQEDYLIRWTEGNSYSCTFLNFFRGKDVGTLNRSWVRKIIELGKMSRMKTQERKFHQAWRRGQMLALRELSEAKS